MSPTQFIDVIENWLESVGAANDALPGPVDALLWKQVEAHFERQMPDDLQMLYARHDGFTDWLYFFQTWLIVPASEILAASRMLRAAHSMDLSLPAWRPDWLPFAADGAGNSLFLDLPTSNINKFDHEGGLSMFLFDHLDAFLGQIASDIGQQLYSFQHFEVDYHGTAEW